MIRKLVLSVAAVTVLAAPLATTTADASWKCFNIGGAWKCVDTR